VIRLYVLGLHPIAWGCVGCQDSWKEDARQSAAGRGPFRVYAEGHTIEHGYSGRRRKGWLHVREVPA